MDRSQHHWRTADLDVYLGPRGTGRRSGWRARYACTGPPTLDTGEVADYAFVMIRTASSQAGGLSRRVRFSKRSLSVGDRMRIGLPARRRFASPSRGLETNLLLHRTPDNRRARYTCVIDVSGCFVQPALPSEVGEGN
jgi:hypothetical protein